ncbi:MAG: cysteine hydrolase family protein [Dehalococcoidia bacterium]
MVKFEIDPRTTALLVIDMTKAYFTQDSPAYLPTAEEILPRLNKLLALCRSRGMLIIHTRPAHRADGSDMGLLALFLPSFRDEKMDQARRDRMELYSGLDVKEGDIVIDKIRFNIFEGTELDLILRQGGIDTLIIGGVATNTCCDMTAKQASQLNYRVIFLSNGNGARALPKFGGGQYTPEEVQQFVLSTLASIWAQVASVDEVMAEIQGK